MTQTAQKVETSRMPPRSETPEAAQVKALSELPRDLAVIKMENDNIMAMATAHPRDYAAVLADIRSQLTTFRSFAESAIYAKPVGRLDKCPKCGKDSNYKETCWSCKAEIPMKIARGLSVRAAEAIAAAYKYNRVRTDSVDIDADKVRVEATFVDYQTGRLWQDASVLSKTFRKRDGSTSRIPDDRFYNVVVQARKSILIRECINRMVPPGLRTELFEIAEAELAKMLDPETIKKIIANFATIGVTKEALETFFGKKIDVLNREDYKVLAGIWTDIKDGGSTVEEVFGIQESVGASRTTQQAADIANKLKKPPTNGDSKEPPKAEKGGTTPEPGPAQSAPPPPLETEQKQTAPAPRRASVEASDDALRAMAEAGLSKLYPAQKTLRGIADVTMFGASGWKRAEREQLERGVQIAKAMNDQIGEGQARPDNEADLRAWIEQIDANL